MLFNARTRKLRARYCSDWGVLHEADRKICGGSGQCNIIITERHPYGGPFDFTQCGCTQVWAPEHGFRGEADAGEHVEDGRDPKTGIPIKSLYGKTKRPPTDWLEGLDWVIYDIQDVGVRFYTYSTTLSYVIDACVEAGVPLMIMDRGNPNGHYIDGPILKPGFESMVGLHPIPVVHGLTMGEYASMVYGEHWMPATENEQWRTAFEKKGGIEVIHCKGYSHR